MSIQIKDGKAFMEFFHEPKIDWMGKKWWFIGVSIPLLFAGLISMAVKGLTYGIDFRGGTLVYVKFAQTPNLDKIRRQLDAQGLHNATLQGYGAASNNEIVVGLDLKSATSGSAIDAGKKATIEATSALYGAPPAGKLDFNNASASEIADHLTAADPLGLASKGSATAAAAYQALAKSMVSYRNGASAGGLVRSFDQLKAVPGVTATVLGVLQADYYLSSYSIFNSEVVGPKVGSDLRRQALYVTLAGLGAMLVYIWFRFELIYGVAAVIATFHDVMITLGIFSLLNKEITLTVIAALLTLVGYSMNDTIVVFDRIRENLRLNKRDDMLTVVNHSINQTLSRTLLTSGLTFLAVFSLYLFGGEVIHGFAFVLVVGVIIGTYSSIAIASPVLVFWQQRTGKGPAGKPVASERSKPSKPYVRETAGARR